MIVLNACKAAAVAIVGSLAYHSGRNMVQTRQICAAAGGGAATAAPRLVKNAAVGGGGPTTVEGLKKMNRAELIELFMRDCEAPGDIEEIEGQWNGVLLRNNGLTRVTRFITNRLFGKGREWNGKRFAVDSTSSSSSGADGHHLVGRNRFDRFSVVRDPKMKKIRSTVILVTDEDRPFRAAMATSRFDPLQQQRSVILDYANETNPLLWRSMKDEIRVVPSTQGKILLGLGSMSWAGGKWNAAPFCLYKTGNKRL